MWQTFPCDPHGRASPLSTCSPLCRSGTATARARPKTGRTISVVSRSVPLVGTLPGRAVAQESVEARPRGDGFVSGILWTPRLMRRRCRRCL